MRCAKLALALPILLGLSASQAQAGAGLIITPNFGTTITGDTANSAAIESTINSAIGVYEARFTNPITVSIDFEEMTSGLGQSQTGLITTDYGTYRSALIADKSHGGDDTAFLASLPASGNPVPGQGSANVETTTAAARALGFNVGGFVAGGYDSQISLNTSITNDSRTGPYDANKYDLQAVVSHEIDEALGVNSTLDSGFPAGYVGPTDFFRYSAPGARSFTTDPNAVSYLSLDGGQTDIVNFNQGSSGDRHDWAGSATPRVQDAFGTPGSAPNLGPAEFAALDVVGYDTPSAAPEPSQVAGLGLTAFGVLGLILKARKRKGGGPAA